MSRDQRPGRVVMVDTAPVTPPIERRASDPLDSGIAGQTAAPTALPKSGMLLWVVLFLLACAAGAVGFSLMARAGVL
ncbi:hypothetical protein BH10PSE14_BH10PSE14_13740 [soil metagenome]